MGQGRPMMSFLASGGWDPLSFDSGAVVWTFFVFIAVVFVMKKMAWGPILNALEARENQVKSGLEEAERARDEARRLSEEFDAKFKAAQADAQRMADEARAGAERLAAQIEADAKGSADKLIDRARREIAVAQRHALDEVRALAVDLSIDAAGAVLEKSVDSDDNRKLAAKVIKMVKKEGTGT